MRIRTIKPEFWTHPVMTQQDDATKLLAIGLLNYADDEGYFYAAPALVRAALRPFDDDSTIARGSLENLSKIGYIEIRNHPTHGDVGMVIGFAEHQRVDRPKSSIIKPLYDSTNDRRMIDDESRKNVAVSGNREQGTGNGVYIVLGEPAQIEMIYEAYPRKIAKPAALRAIRKALAKHSFEFLLSCAKRYAISRAGQDPNFTPHPATWFNQERFNDDPATWGMQGRSSGQPAPPLNTDRVTKEDVL
jgi:hypothetical protein